MTVKNFELMKNLTCPICKASSICAAVLPVQKKFYYYCTNKKCRFFSSTIVVNNTPKGAKITPTYVKKEIKESETIITEWLDFLKKK